MPPTQSILEFDPTTGVLIYTDEHGVNHPTAITKSKVTLNVLAELPGKDLDPTTVDITILVKNLRENRTKEEDLNTNQKTDVLSF